MNHNPEQLARDRIDDQLTASGWILQYEKSFSFAAGFGVTIREFRTSLGLADYVLFVRKPVGFIEARREEEGVRLITVDDQYTDYASAKLKYNNADPPPFVYESPGEVPILRTTVI